MISEPWEAYCRSHAEGAICVFDAYGAATMAVGAVIAKATVNKATGQGGAR